MAGNLATTSTYNILEICGILSFDLNTLILNSIQKIKWSIMAGGLLL